jgi:hypothetical protein
MHWVPWKSLQFVNVFFGMLGRVLRARAEWPLRGEDVTFIRETRRSKRKTFEYVALLDFRDGEEPRPCEVRDISAGGARLAVFVAVETIPENFTLLLSPTAKVRRDCKVAWRSADEIGVRFIPPPDAIPRNR